jgi:hypothetical protein
MYGKINLTAFFSKTGVGAGTLTVPVTGITGMSVFWIIIVALTAFTAASAIATLIPKRER